MTSCTTHAHTSTRQRQGSWPETLKLTSVNVGSHDSTGLKWNIETSEDGQWKYITPMQNRVLAGINKAVTTTLRRTEPGAVQDVHLILGRIIKGKVMADPSMFFGAEMRRTVMFTLFAASGCTTCGHDKKLWNVAYQRCNVCQRV